MTPRYHAPDMWPQLTALLEQYMPHLFDWSDMDDDSYRWACENGEAER
jgi:hypothetical protein